MGTRINNLMPGVKILLAAAILALVFNLALMAVRTPCAFGQAACPVSANPDFKNGASFGFGTAYRITLAGTPAENDQVMFEISRVVASDTMAGDARLIGVKLLITTNAANAA